MDDLMDTSLAAANIILFLILLLYTLIMMEDSRVDYCI